MWSPCHTTALVTLSRISVSVIQHPCCELFHSQISDHRNSASVSQGQQSRKTGFSGQARSFMQKEPSLQI